MSQCWQSWCFLVVLEVLVIILSTVWACMIDGLLVGSLEQYEATFAILVLFGPVGGAVWHS